MKYGYIGIVGPNSRDPIACVTHGACATLKFQISYFILIANGSNVRDVSLLLIP